MTKTVHSASGPLRPAAFVAIGALAVAVRVVFAVAFSRTPIGSYTYLDSLSYERLAVALTQGTGPALEPFFVEPLYAYFLAAVFELFGRELWPVRILQILAGTAVALLLADLARRLYGRRAGWAAGLAVAFYGPFVLYDSMLLKTSGEVLFATLVAWMLVRYLQAQPRASSWAIAGLVLGLAVALKANFLVLVPLVIAAPFLVAGRSARVALGQAAITACAFGAVLLPFVVRNTLLAGELTFLTNGAGMNFYQGNRENTDGGLDIPEFIGTDPLREQEDSIAEARRRTADPSLTAADASRFWFAESLRFVREQPIDWLLLMGRKTLLFWNHYEAADNLSFYYAREVVPWLWLAPVGFWLVAPLGLAGTLAGAGAGRAEWSLRAAVVLLMAGTVLFHVADRYRLAAVPLLIVLGVGFCRASWLRWQERRRSEALARVGLVLAATLLVVIPDFYTGGQDMTTYDRIMAVGYARDGEESLAEPYRQRAASAYYERAIVLLEQGQLARARINFHQLLELDPEWPGLWYHLGITEERLGAPERAIAAYARESSVERFVVPALTRRAELLLRARDLEEAERSVLRGREIDPRDPGLLVVLGDLRALQGRMDEALELFEAALEITPDAEPVKRRIELARARSGSAAAECSEPGCAKGGASARER